MMISGTHTAFAAMQDSSDRLAQTAQSIANGGPVHANNALASESNATSIESNPAAPAVPASADPDASSAMQLIDLKQTEMVFKTSALAARTLIETSQDLMDALR